MDKQNWYINAMKLYSSVKKEVLAYAITWIKPGYMLDEISHI